MALTAERKYRLLVELSQRISRTLDLGAVLDDLLQALRSAIAYDAAGVFVLNRAVPLRADGNLIAGMVQLGFDKPLAEDPMLRSGRGIIGHVIRTGETLNVADVRRDPRYIAGRVGTLSELAVPIVSEAGVIGCLNVESDTLAAFSEADAELLQFFASAAALSIEKALLHRQVLEKQRLEDQLSVARDVQAGLLPGGPPRLAGYDVAAVNLPTHAIGGDYYDYVPLDSDRLALVVADVSGKGVPAALLMASFRAALRTEIRRHGDLRALAGELNAAVLEFRDAARFVTAVCCVLDAASGALRYVNCGHNPPLLLRCDGTREALCLGGPALGLKAGERFEAGLVTLEPGDGLVLYTDGVVEPADVGDAEFGVERLEAAVRGASGRPASEALDAVIAATRSFSGRVGYEDDFTLVVLNRLGQPSGSEGSKARRAERSRPVLRSS
jgi:serine phosphatase RsbU (regulator of sigma subunit)